MLHWVSVASLIMSIAAFLLFAITILVPRSSAAPGRRDMTTQSEIEGLAKLTEALSKLVEALSKAGPPALTIFASIVFMAISLIAARP